MTQDVAYVKSSLIGWDIVCVELNTGFQTNMDEIEQHDNTLLGCESSTIFCWT